MSLTQEEFKSLNSIKVLLHEHLYTLAYILYYLDLDDKRFLMPIKKNDALEDTQEEKRGTSIILSHFSLISGQLIYQEIHSTKKLKGE